MHNTERSIDRRILSVRKFAQTQTFRTVKIVCFTNLHQADAPVIPIGILGEVNFAHIRGYGLYARSYLTSYEHGLISDFISNSLKDPLSFVRSCVRPYFNEMQDNVDIRGHLVDLLEMEAGTISFINSEEHSVESAWREGAYEKIKSSVQDSLRKTVIGQGEALEKEASKLVKYALAAQTNESAGQHSLLSKKPIEIKDFEYDYRIAA